MLWLCYVLVPHRRFTLVWYSFWFWGSIYFKWLQGNLASSFGDLPWIGVTGSAFVEPKQDVVHHTYISGMCIFESKTHWMIHSKWIETSSCVAKKADELAVNHFSLHFKNRWVDHNTFFWYEYKGYLNLEISNGLVGGCKYFLFSPLPGEMIQFD